MQGCMSPNAVHQPAFIKRVILLSEQDALLHTVQQLLHTAPEGRLSRTGVAWSAADPWMFASLSYDGRIAVNRVPSAVKYKILI